MNNPSVPMGFKFQVLHTTEGFLSVVTLNAVKTVRSTEVQKHVRIKVLYTVPRSAFKGDSV
jgi:hypothetical protein